MTHEQLLDLLNQMTLEEKVGQMTQSLTALLADTAFLPTGPATARNLSPEQAATIGSVLDFSDCSEAFAAQDKQMAAHRLHIPMLFMMDVIHGYRTTFPVPLGVAASFDPSLMEECSRMAAKESASGSVHVTFTPMVDLSRDPRWGRCVEGAGEDPLLACRMGAAQVRGFQGDSLDQPDTIVACVKHFAAYGASESGRDYNRVELSENALREYYLPPYKACIDAGAKMLMPSFNSLNGIPATVNPWLMQDVLKKEWGFDGVVITDFTAIRELIPHGVAADLKEAALLGIENGSDIEMESDAYMKHLPELVAEGKVDIADIDRACLKVLELKNELGLFEDPYRGASPEKEAATCLTPEHRAIARRAAEESAILLKNNGLLPFAKVDRLALIGPFADSNAIVGFWACHGKNEDCVSVREGLAAILPDTDITCVKGCDNLWNSTDESGIPAAVEAARAADAVVLCLGEPQNYTGESNCRADVNLPGPQMALARAVIEANPNTAVVLFNGRPLVLSELDEIAPAILDMWFPGCEGGSAAANLLFGRANPCAKVPMSFPRHLGQIPVYYNRTSIGRPKSDDTQPFAPFCSNYIDCRNSPLYPFGYGLSYSTFRYDSLTIDRSQMDKDGCINVDITLTNTSEVEGKEVVQLYMRDMVASTVRPVCQLIDFQKVTLAPGETKTVSFTVTEPMLRIWSKNNKWESESGEFTLFTGCADNLIFPTVFTLI